MKKFFGLIVLLCGIVNYSFAEEAVVCNHTCDVNTDGKWIYCNKLLYICRESLGWDEVSNMSEYKSFAVPCDYSDPTTRIVGDYTYENDLEDSYFTIFGKNPLQAGVLMERSDDFCYGCARGCYSYDSTGFCDVDLERAWCEWFIDKNEEYDVDWDLDEDRCVCYDPGMTWKKEQHACVSSEIGDGGVGDDRLKIAIDNMNRFFESAKSNPSAWKDTEGNFNTARLVSDATAGVVLGTVGGIVSARVIKKKQLEKGFDALNCSISGQKVADFGDEFTVGFGK